MACSVASTSLTTLNRLKSHLNLTADDLKETALTIYHDGSESATAATVEVLAGSSGLADTLELIITGGANAGTQTIDLTAAANDTLSELVSVILGFDEGWVVEQHLQDDEATINLDVLAATSAYGVSNKQRLTMGDNCYLVNLIDGVSSLVEQHCGRKFKSATYKEKRTIQQNGIVQVVNWPIIDLLRISLGTQQALRITNSQSDAGYATVRVSEDNGDIDFTIYGGAGAGTQTVSTGSSTSLTSVASSINALSYNWSAGVENGLGNVPSDWLLDQGGLTANKTGTANTVYLNMPDDPLSDFDLDYDTGMVYVTAVGDYTQPDSGARFRRGRHSYRGLAFVEYTGGYSTIPAGLEMIVLDIIKSNYDRQKITGGLKREKLGDYEYEMADGSSGSSASVAVTKDQLGDLAPYCSFYV